MAAVSKFPETKETAIYFEHFKICKQLPIDSSAPLTAKFPSRAGEAAPRCESHHPPVPKVTDHVATPLRHRRNFVAKNAVDAMISAAVETAPEDERFVDGPDGNTQNKSKSGMAQVYTQQKVRTAVLGTKQVVVTRTRITQPSQPFSLIP